MFETANYKACYKKQCNKSKATKNKVAMLRQKTKFAKKETFMKDLMYQSFHFTPAQAVNEQLSALEELMCSLKERLKPKTIDEHDALEEYQKSFLVRYVYNSASIEGTTLTQLDTALVLDGEFVPSDDKEVQDMFATKGCLEGYDFMLASLENNVELSQDFIKDIHLRTALDCQPRARGTYRIVPVQISGSKTVPVNPVKVRECMNDLLFFYENTTVHPVIAACAFHALFENIHPFRDGNGRTGRTLLNYMLLKKDYPAIAVKNDDRKAYFAALQDWQVNFEPAPLIKMAIKNIMQEANNKLEVLEQTRAAVSASDL